MRSEIHNDRQDVRDELAARVLGVCLDEGWYIAAAESLTGGLLADAFVRIPGASRVFLGSAVTYDIAAKAAILGVDKTLLDKEGAVHPLVARQMAVAAARLYETREELTGRVIGLATTGVAGPGPDGDKPAGLVYIAISIPAESGRRTYAYELNLEGGREEIRHDTVETVLQDLIENLV